MPRASMPSPRRTRPTPRYERVPMLRGRIVSANGVRAEDLKAPPNAAWVLQSDRGITYAGEVPAGSRVVAGEWWGPDYQGPPLVSFEKQDRRRARPQDRRSGRRQRARPQHHGDARQPARGRLAVARHQFRAGLFAGRFRGAPHTHIATLHLSGRRDRRGRRWHCSRRRPAEFPTATAVRVREALEAVAKVVFDLTLGDPRRERRSRLIAAVLVLAGALATGHRHRVYDAVVLKMLGATRAPAARRLCARIPADRACHRDLRRRGRLARRLSWS